MANTEPSLESIRILYRDRCLALWGIPYAMRSGQSPKDLDEPMGKYGRMWTMGERGWIWLGNPGWFGAMSSERIADVKEFLKKHADRVPTNPFEWDAIEEVI